MDYRQFSSRICDVCALIAVALALPVLAHAGENNGNQNGLDKVVSVVSVPEAGPGIALLAATIAILLFTVRRSQAKGHDCFGERL
jgi:hypothetical protein